MRCRFCDSLPIPSHLIPSISTINKSNDCWMSYVDVLKWPEIYKFFRYFHRFLIVFWIWESTTFCIPITSDIGCVFPTDVYIWKSFVWIVSVSRVSDVRNVWRQWPSWPRVSDEICSVLITVIWSRKQWIIWITACISPDAMGHVLPRFLIYYLIVPLFQNKKS